MDADDLVRFWSPLGDYNVHPADRNLISAGKFATNLKPVPWSGPLRSARVFLLFQNPGLDPLDEYYETSRSDFRAAVTRNLLGEEPYLYLQPSYQDHSGYRWANRIFGAIDFRVADKICVLQLVAYHSEKGDAANQVARTLPSSSAIRRFVHESLVNRARAGEIGLIVARSQRLWCIADAQGSSNLIIYKGSECRGALQTCKSRGGKLLRNVLAQAD